MNPKIVIFWMIYALLEFELTSLFLYFFIIIFFIYQRKIRKVAFLLCTASLSSWRVETLRDMRIRRKVPVHLLKSTARFFFIFFLAAVYPNR